MEYYYYMEIKKIELSLAHMEHNMVWIENGPAENFDSTQMVISSHLKFST